jgi:hypothetical protein
MPLNLDTFPAEVRAKQITLGRRFSSSETLEQAKLTLNAIDKYGSLLAAEGFSTADRQRLLEARDLLVAAGVGRQTARAGRKSANRAYAQAFEDAKTERLRARTILENTMAALRDFNDAASIAAVQAIAPVLEQTSALPEDSEGLATQLNVLGTMLKRETVSEEAGERGGTEAQAALTTTSAALRAMDQQSTLPAGTPAETQRLDQIDGIIVDVVRRARKAAISAARRRADPALARAFQLRALYPNRAEAEDEEEESDTEPGGEPDMTAAEPSATPVKGKK